MKLSFAFAIVVLCASSFAVGANQTADSASDEKALLRIDREALGLANFSVALKGSLLDTNFTWTNTFGSTRDKSETLHAIRSGNGLPTETGSGNGAGAAAPKSGTAIVRTYGPVGIVQEHTGKVYILRVWIKRGANWQLLIDQEVSIGAPPSAESDKGNCENPCNTVPFQPGNNDERDVIHAYQAVERAVTAHDSASWGAHIADEFFAVTSNSDRPLDKATRMAGLDNQKVAGIAPFPLVSARMFQFGDAMVMTSRQQPEHGLPLHVTRVWFKRGGAWLEAYSYQTTIQAETSTR
jgi:hypothetical protein